MQRLGLSLLLLLLCAGPAGAQRLTVLAPAGEGPEAVAFAAELGDAIDRGLAITPSLRKANPDPLLPAELELAFGCVRVDLACARAATRAAGTDLALLSRFELRADRVTVHADLVAADRRAPVRSATWVVGPLRGVEDPRLRIALRHILARFLSGSALRPVVVPEAGVELRLAGELLPPLRASDVPPGRLRLDSPGHPPRIHEVAAGDVLLVTAPPRLHPGPAPQAPTLRVAAWLTAGGAAAAFVAAAVVSAQLQSTQADYNRAANGRALDRLADQGERQALTAKALYTTGGLALGAAALLFWISEP